MVTKGYAAPEVGSVYARARALCEQVGELPQRLPIVLGLRNFYQVRGDFHTARVLGEQGIALAQRGPDDALRVHAHMGLGHTLFSLGEFGRARAHLEQGMAFYDPQRQHSYTFSQGKGAGVSSLTLLAWLLCYLAYPTQALARVQEALTLASNCKFGDQPVSSLASSVRPLLMKSIKCCQLSKTIERVNARISSKKVWRRASTWRSKAYVSSHPGKTV